MDEFLMMNHLELTATSADLYHMSLAVESNEWLVDEIEHWLRRVQ